MLNWMDTPTPAGSLSLLRDPHVVIAALPVDNAVAAVAQITEALAALNSSETLRLEERYDDIYLLDAAAVEHTHLLLREYLNTSRHVKQREDELWRSAYQCWRALAAAYAMCVQQYAADPAATAGFGKLAQVAVARAIRARRRQLQWLRIRYAAPEAEIWTGLAQLYTYIEPHDIDADMLIYPGETTTIKREFLKALVQSALSCESLLPPEQDLVTFIVSRYAPAFVLSKKSLPGCTHWFDLKHPQLPARVSSTPAPDADLRYFGPGSAADSLAQALRAIETTGHVPADMGFRYEIDLPILTSVLVQMNRDWSGQTHERAHEREKTNARITVVPGFEHMLNVLEQTVADPFDFTEKAEVESWVVNDISAAGFGAVLPAITGDWVSVGSVAGIEGNVAGEWMAAMVRRAWRREDGQLQIGMQVLSRNAQAVRMMREDAGSDEDRVIQRMPIDSAILLTPHAARQPAVELLVADASLYDAGIVHMLLGDIALLLQFREVLEKNGTCARVGFGVLGIAA
jgi:hypothetical protein